MSLSPYEHGCEFGEEWNQNASDSFGPLFAPVRFQSRDWAVPPWLRFRLSGGLCLGVSFELVLFQASEYALLLPLVFGQARCPILSVVALLFRLTLALRSGNRRWFVCPGSDTNICRNAKSAHLVYSLVASLYRLADHGEEALEIGAVAAVNRDESKSSQYPGTSCLRMRLPSSLLNLIADALVLHLFEHPLAFCDVLSDRRRGRTNGDN